MDEVKDTTLSLSDATGEHTPLIRSSEVSKNNYRYRYNHHLPLSLKAAYALGHVFNDISAAMWFSYMLLFLQMVLGMSPALSGGMLLIGELQWLPLSVYRNFPLCISYVCFLLGCFLQHIYTYISIFWRPRHIVLLT